MIWDGETVYTSWGYQPITAWSVSYKPLANGYPEPRDRGAGEDAFSGAVVFKGPLEELEALESVLDGNRSDFDITCGDGEEIFGADVAISGALSVTVENYGDIERVSYGQYAMPLRLRLLAPTFTGVAASLSALRLSSWRYGAFSKFDITKHFSYVGDASYLDHRTDPGVFVGEFTQTTAEMAAIRRALLTTVRGAAIQFPELGGVLRPFGTRKPEWLYNKCHVLQWEDMGRENFLDWRLRITFAQADPYFAAGDDAADDFTEADHLTAGTSGTPDLHGTPGG
jgi:hypothetical protein